MTEPAAADSVELRVNGERREVPADLTLAGLLDHLELDPRTVVVEHNREIVRGEKLDERPVQEGDQVEIVHFVGGG